MLSIVITPSLINIHTQFIVNLWEEGFQASYHTAGLNERQLKKNYNIIIVSYM